MMEKAIEKQTGGEAKVDMQGDGAMKIETDEGTFTTGGDLPDNWPTDVAVYEDATVSYSASTNPATGKPGSALVLMTTDASADVAAWYKSQLTKDGWTLSSAMEGGGTTIFGATKDDRTLSMMIAGAEGQTSITIGIEGGAN